MTPEQMAAEIVNRAKWHVFAGVKRPEPPFLGLDVEIADAIRAAIATERARCAAIARGFTRPGPYHSIERDAQDRTARSIAEAIESGGQP